jgi:hypothetical protein
VPDLVQGKLMPQRGDLQLQGQASPKARGEQREEEVEQANHEPEHDRWWQIHQQNQAARLFGIHSELLAPIYDWFTEGFDTSDLKDGKAMLEHLS